MSESDKKHIDRIIQEFVPGKQVTLAHVISAPSENLCERVGMNYEGAAGILTLTPGETAIIAGDIASKTSSITISFLDRFSGALVFTGSIGDVEEALRAVLYTLENALSYTICDITKS